MLSSIRNGARPLRRIVVAVAAVAVAGGALAQAGIFLSANMRNGDWNGGQTGWGIPGGIVNTPDGVEFTGRQAIISWYTPDGAKRTDFRTSGTASAMVNAQSGAFVGGWLFDGAPSLPYGLSTFAFNLTKGTNQVVPHLASWHNNWWLRETAPTGFDYDEWHHVGVAWGGPDNDFEICVDGQVIHAYDLPPGRSLPWGGYSSATWFGLGHHHARYRNSHSGPAGVTISDVFASTDWLPACGTFGGPVGPTEVEISMSGKVNLKSKGVVPVTILTTDDFDATSIDASTLAFGPAGAGIAHKNAHIEDVDGDGDLDMVVHFKVPETGIGCGDTEAELTGETTDGTEIIGTQEITTKGC